MKQELCNEVRNYALQRFKEEAEFIKNKGRSPMLHYRKEHTLTVVGLARNLAQQTGADQIVCEVAAWLHDLAKCYNPRLSEAENEKRQARHGYYGAEEGRNFLRELGVEQAIIDEVYIAIEKHVGLTREFKEPLTPLSAAITWDADKLSKIGWSAWLHFLAYTLNREKEEQNLLELLSRDRLDVMEMISEHFNTGVARELAQKRITHYRENLAHMEGVLKGKI